MTQQWKTKEKGTGLSAGVKRLANYFDTATPITFTTMYAIMYRSAMTDATDIPFTQINAYHSGTEVTVKKTYDHGTVSVTWLIIGI